MSSVRVVTGENDLESYCKKHNLQYILDEWDYSHNNGLSPSTISYGSKILIQWICVNKHPFPQTVNARTSQRQGCPYCAGRKIWRGFNDLESQYPDIAKELSPQNNIPAYLVNIGSSNRFLWCCSKCGHEWRTSVNNRTYNNSGCPACAGQVVVKGKNDLASQFPRIASEWDYSKNDKSPDEFTAKCRKRAYWICSICGYSYPMTIQSRTVHHQGCPRCAKRWQTSFPEQAIYYYVKEIFPDAENGCKSVLDGRFELDIYIPSKRVGIEYDGSRWHASKAKRDLKKYELCKANGIKLIRISELQNNSEDIISDKTIVSEYSQGKQLECLLPAINELLSFWGIQKEIDIQKDSLRIQEQYYQELKRNSAGILFPELLKEWDQERNGKITLFMLSPSDKHAYWWICSKCGKEWQASVGSRTQGRGCRDCGYITVGAKIAKHRIAKNGSLSDKYPDVAKEWDYKKNGNTKPYEVASKSNKVYFWKCPKDHPSYPARVADRTQKKTGCPLCAPNKSRKVMCIETGTVYDSVRQAKLSTGFTNIERCVRGQGKTAGGYHWKFVDK